MFKNFRQSAGLAGESGNAVNSSISKYSVPSIWVLALTGNSSQGLPRVVGVPSFQKPLAALFKNKCFSLFD